MGMSADAYLFYGYCWFEQESLVINDEGEGIDYEDAILRRRGVIDPHSTRPDYSHLPYRERREAEDKWRKDHKEELADWYAKGRTVIAEFGLRLSRYGYVDYTSPYLYVVASKVSADSGSPKQVKALAVGEGWTDSLNRLLEELGIPKPQPEPGWWLVADYG